LVVINLNTGETVFSGHKSSSSINGLALSFHGVIRLVMSTNDATITVFELPSMREIAKMMCPNAVNYALASPDGQILAGVGDHGNVVYLFSVKDDTYTPLGPMSLTVNHRHDVSIPGINAKGFMIGGKEIPHSSRSSMSLSWNATSTLLCCGSEDGLITVYDMTKVDDNNSPELVFYHRGSKPARACKFSPVSSIPLLVATNTNQVHVIEIGTWRMQTWKTPSDVSGLTFSPDGKQVYVGTIDGTYILPFNCDLRSLVDLCIWFIKREGVLGKVLVGICLFYLLT